MSEAQPRLRDLCLAILACAVGGGLVAQFSIAKLKSEFGPPVPLRGLELAGAPLSIEGVTLDSSKEQIFRRLGKPVGFSSLGSVRFRSGLIVRFSGDYANDISGEILMQGEQFVLRSGISEAESESLLTETGPTQQNVGMLPLSFACCPGPEEFIESHHSQRRWMDSHHKIFLPYALILSFSRTNRLVGI